MPRSSSRPGERGWSLAELGAPEPGQPGLSVPAAQGSVLPPVTAAKPLWRVFISEERTGTFPKEEASAHVGWWSQKSGCLLRSADLPIPWF